MIASGEGLGNSFWIAQAADLQASGTDVRAYAVDACSGSEPRDGLLLLHSIDENGVQEAEVINRDGSDGGVCLNGLRVLAIWSGQERGVFAMAGKHIPWTRISEEVELHLPASSLSSSFWSPTPVKVEGRDAYSVEFWNPHCVIPVADPEMEDLSILAAAARADVLHFPEGVNVELITSPIRGCMSMRVHERGVGETQACGSGAVAAAAVAWDRFDLQSDAPLKVQIRGGELLLRREQMGGIFLRGGAQARAVKGL